MTTLDAMRDLNRALLLAKVGRARRGLFSGSVPGNYNLLVEMRKEGLVRREAGGWWFLTELGEQRLQAIAEALEGVRRAA